MPDVEREQWMDELEEGFLAKGETFSRKALSEDLENIRRQGYAVAVGDRLEGTFAITAPVIDVFKATIAAVNVAGAVERLTPKRIESLSIEVRDAAKTIGERYDV